MKLLIIAFLAVTIMDQPVSIGRVPVVSQLYIQNIADILDPSFPKLA